MGRKANFYCSEFSWCELVLGQKEPSPSFSQCSLSGGKSESFPLPNSSCPSISLSLYMVFALLQLSFFFFVHMLCYNYQWLMLGPVPGHLSICHFPWSHRTSKSGRVEQNHKKRSKEQGSRAGLLLGDFKRCGFSGKL